MLISLAISLFVVLPVLSMLVTFGLMVIEKKHYIWYVALFALSLGVIAYNLIPIEEYDLSRYYFIMDDLANMSFSDAMVESISRVDILSYLMMYAVALTGDYNMLQFIAVSAGYFLFITPLLDIMNKRNYTWKSKAFILLSFMALFEFIAIFSGVRNYIAIGLFFFILYRDLGLSKKTHFALYLLPALFHVSMVVPAILTLFVRSNFPAFRKILGTLLVACGLFLPSILNFVATSRLAAEIGIASKLQWYEVNYTAILYDDGYMFKGMIFIALFTIFVIIRHNINRAKLNKIDTSRTLVQVRLIWMLALLTIGLMLANKTFFVRYALITELCLGWYILDNLYVLRHKQRIILGVIVFTMSITSIYMQYIYVSLLSAETPWIDYVFKPVFLIGV